MSRVLLDSAAALGRRQRAGAGDARVVEAVARDFRFWAALPARVHAIVILGDPHGPAAEKMLAVVQRPRVPKGVCTGCGCSQFDACPGAFGEGCAWRDATQTRCTSCPPADPPAAAARVPRRGRCPRRGRR
ncbi:MAG: hypothetical protein AB7R67_20080 [Vicinamibacterales bacterium]